MIIFKINSLWTMVDGDAPSDGFDAFIASHIDDASTDGGGSDDSVDTSADSITDVTDTDTDDADAVDDTDDADLDDNDDTDDDNDDSDDSTNAEFVLLREQNAQLMALFKQMQKKDAPKESTPEPPKDPFESEGFKNLSDGMGWDADEQALMKTFLQDVMAYNQTVTMQKAQEDIPEIVNSTMTAKQKQEAVHAAFYKENPELEMVKPYVSQIAQTVANEFADAGKAVDVPTVLNEVAKRAYKALGLTKQSKAKASADSEPGRGKKKAPAFAKSKGSRKKTSKMSADQKMIQDMINLDM